MAYALIAWRAPDDADATTIESELNAALSLRNGATTPMALLPNVLLYPSSKPAGVGADTILARVQPVVDAHPGLQLLLIMPERGDTVRGWFDPGAFDMARAQKILNQEGNDTYPIWDGEDDS